jgi:hypothetical protein
MICSKRLYSSIIKQADLSYVSAIFQHSGHRNVVFYLQKNFALSSHKAFATLGYQNLDTFLVFW